MARRTKNCLDCNKLILEYSKRCQSCAQKERFTRMKVWNQGLTKENDPRLDYKRPAKWKKGEIPKGSILFGTIPAWNKGKPYLKIRGENHWQWKGGITPKNTAIRMSLEYKLWARTIKERDNFTCQVCRKRGNGIVHADHIKPFSLFPELRFDIDNGRTLC